MGIDAFKNVSGVGDGGYSTNAGKTGQDSIPGSKLYSVMDAYKQYKAQGSSRGSDLSQMTSDYMHRAMGWNSGNPGEAAKFSVEHETDDNGLLRRSISRGSDGSVESIRDFTYNNGKLVNELLINGEGLAEYKCEYGDNGQPKKKISYNPDGSVKSIVNYSYDNGEVIKELVSDPNEGLEERFQEYEYDAQGREIKVISYDNGKISFSETTYADENDTVGTRAFYNHRDLRVRYSAE